VTGQRVVIIGAGVVGAALADELSVRGWTDVTVVDQGPLPEPGGSSSHAPGLVFQANPSKTMTEMARYTVEKLGALELAGEPCFLQVGGLEVATTPERLAELHRRCGWLTSWGVEARVVGPDECAALHPLLDRGVVLGGLHTPTDGIAKAVRAVDAQLRAAAARGVRVLDRHEVTGISVHDGRVTGVVTNRGELPADVVVCCAGIWGPKVAAMVGVALPLTPLAHQLAVSDPLPALAGHDREATHPILRHQGADLYLRERGESIAVGYYGHDPLPVDARDIVDVDEAEVMPSVLPFTEHDFAPGWADAQALVPALREAKIEEAMNGLFSFTTDGMPLMGESREVRGFWTAEAVWVTHSCGVAKAMAEWLVDGRSTSFDLHECDANRFWPHQLAPEFVLVKNRQNYVEVYDALHPLEPMLAPRPLRTSPFYERERALGAVFLEAAGWERPQWYEANAALVAGRDIPTPAGWAARWWSPVVGAEAQITRERVAMYDMTSLTRIEVGGRGAAAFLQRVTTGNVDRPVGTVTYCLLLDEGGGIRSDVTVARLGTEEFQIGANGPLDLDLLLRAAPDGVVVRDVTAGTCCIGVWGPLAREVVLPLARDLADVRYFRGRRVHVGTVPVTALRLSYVGELGWELYTTADMGRTLWDTLWEAGREHGIIAAGRGAFDALRLEKGYRSFGTDMTFEHDPWEAGLGFAVKLDKGEFTGRDAVLRRRDDVRRRLACLTLDETVLGNEPVFADGRPVGYVTSAAHGHTVGRGIAYAWLPAELATPDREVEIGWFDRRIPAVVTQEPLVDPGMERLRG
jgi:glycine cleavage system aminomethyltransferase T/glycine/D-amino acid oxidase-like deaminating enzyme